MKRIIFALLLASVGFAQQSNRVEKGVVDAHAATWIPPTVTFASPPSSPPTGAVYIFTDAISLGTCAGGGTARATCRWNGSAWEATGGGGSGGGSSSLPVVPFDPNTATSLPCPGTNGAQFVASTTLTGAASIATVSCTPATGTAVVVQFVVSQGGTVYGLTLPSPFNYCDFTQMGTSDTMTQSGTYDGTNYLDGSCTLKAGAGNVVRTIDAGTLTLATTSISSTACQTVTPGSINSVASANVLSTDTIIITPNASIKAQTGFIPATTGGLTIAAYPTAGYVNVDVCNWSTGALTPGTVVLNWRVTR